MRTGGRRGGLEGGTKRYVTEAAEQRKRDAKDEERASEGDGEMSRWIWEHWRHGGMEQGARSQDMEQGAKERRTSAWGHGAWGMEHGAWVTVQGVADMTPLHTKTQRCRGAGCLVLGAGCWVTSDQGLLRCGRQVLDTCPDRTWRPAEPVADDMRRNASISIPGWRAHRLGGICDGHKSHNNVNFHRPSSPVSSRGSPDGVAGAEGAEGG